MSLASPFVPVLHWVLVIAGLIVGQFAAYAWLLLLLLLRRRRRLRNFRRIFRFRLRFATDMRDGAVGACRGKGVPWRLTLVHVLWHG